MARHGSKLRLPPKGIAERRGFDSPASHMKISFTILKKALSVLRGTTKHKTYVVKVSDHETTYWKVIP